MYSRNPNSGDGKKNWKLELVKQFIEANPEATMAEIVKACRTSLSTVTRARADLIDAGKLHMSAAGRPRAPKDDAPTEGQETQEPSVEAIIAADIERAIAAGGKVLTREERRQRLSAYADHPKVPHAQRIAALRELENTEVAEESQLGPGAPQTEEEAIHRVALMLEALVDIYGQTAAQRAWARGNPGNFHDGDTEEAILRAVL